MMPPFALSRGQALPKKEAWLIVRRKAATPVINDILANVRHPHGIGAHIMACALDFGVDRPRMPRVGNSIFVKDRKALAAAFRKWRTNRLYRGSS